MLAAGVFLIILSLVFSGAGLVYVNERIDGDAALCTGIAIVILSAIVIVIGGNMIFHT